MARVLLPTIVAAAAAGIVVAALGGGAFGVFVAVIVAIAIVAPTVSWLGRRGGPA